MIGTPSKDPNGPDVSALGPQVAAWAYDRADGGRGFVMGGVDFHDNLRTVDDYRRFLLNGIVWAANVEVPGGRRAIRAAAGRGREIRRLGTADGSGLQGAYGNCFGNSLSC